MTELTLDNDTSASFEALCAESKAISATIQFGTSIIASEIQTDIAGLPDHSEEIIRLLKTSNLKKRNIQNCIFQFPESTILTVTNQQLTMLICLREIESDERDILMQMERFIAKYERQIIEFAEALETQQAYNEKVMLITQSIRLKSTDYYYDDSSYTRDDQDLWRAFRGKLKELLEDIMSDAQADRVIDRTLRKHRIPDGPKVRDIGKVSAEIIQQIPHRVRRRDLLVSLQDLLVNEKIIEDNDNIVRF